jgi:hypothetical protein
MSTPLNAFKTITAVVTTTPTNIYTAPIGVSGIVLGSQISNISNSSATITAWHNRGVVATELVKDFEIPKADAMSIIAGKLVLEGGDSIRVQANENEKLKIVLSVLESANE